MSQDDATPAAGSISTRKLEIASIIILAVATLLTAWSGFQAAKWSGVQSISFSQAGTQRLAANTIFTLGVLELTDMQSNFNFWLNATYSGNDELAQVYAARLEADLPDAWAAWQALNPLDNPDAPQSPLEMDEFAFPTEDDLTEIAGHADSLFQEGVDASQHSDDYVLATVFFALALFFAGVSTSFDYHPVRIATLLVAAVTLVIPSVWILTLPVEFS